MLGLKQPFPQRCFECAGLFATGDRVIMLPVLCEGDVLSVGRWPELSGDYGSENFGGRVLWARWLCEGCAAPRGDSSVDVDDEPAAVRRARLQAERDLNHAAVARGRQAAVERARAQIYEAVDS